MPEATADVAQLIRECAAMWNDQEFAKFSEIVSGSFVMYESAAPAEGIPGPEGEVHGPDGLEQWMRAGVAGFPDRHLTILDMLASDDIVMVEERITGTHEGEFDGIPPTGREVELPAMSKYRVADGNIQEHRVYFDQQGFAEQLGLTEEEE